MIRALALLILDNFNPEQQSTAADIAYAMMALLELDQTFGQPPPQVARPFDKLFLLHHVKDRQADGGG